MRKKYFKLLITVLSVSVAAACFGQLPTYAAPEVIVDENFENCRVGDPPPEGWVVERDNRDEGKYVEITKDPDNPDNKVLCIADPNKTSDNATKATLNFKDIGGDITVSFRIRYSTFPNGVHYVGQTGITMVQSYQNQWNFNDGVEHKVPSNVGTKYNTWETWEFTYRFSEKTWDVKVDGQYYAEGYGFKNVDIESINNIHWANACEYMYVDDIKITNDGELKKNYLKLSSATYNVQPTTSMIYNVGFEVPRERFADYFTFVEGARYEILDKDGNVSEKRFIEKGDKLKISSPEDDSSKEYEIIARSWNASLLTVRYAYDAVIFKKGSSDVICKNERKLINPSDKSVSVVENGETVYIPLRALAESLGKTVEWNGETGSVVCGDVTVKTGSNIALKNGENVELDNEAVILGATTYIPLDWAGVLFDKHIRTEGDIIIIKDNTEIVQKYADKLIISEIAERFKED